VAIKISISLEVMDEASRDQVLKDLRQALIRQQVAPKWKVKLSYEQSNLELGDSMPLDIRAFGVEEDADDGREPLPMERYLNTLESRGG
jgi:hypothetical protein